MRLATTATTVALVAALALAVASGSAAAQSTGGQLYQWKDARGVTHYSETPPARGAYQTRTVHNRAATPVATAVPAAAADPNPSCTRARANLTLLRSDQPVRLAGSETPITDAQRKAQTELAEASIRAHCTDG